MRKQIIMAAGLLAIVVPCRAGQVVPVGKLAGSWEGALVEKGKQSRVRLHLRQTGGKLGGSLAILSGGGGDAKPGTRLDLVNVHLTGPALTFQVHLGGKVSKDSLVFVLVARADKLEGILHELRPGAAPVPIVLTR